MAAKILSKDEIFDSNRITVGFGEVPGFPTENGTYWALPGNVITYCREEATRFATRLDRMIRANMQRTNRSLV